GADELGASSDVDLDADDGSVLVAQRSHHAVPGPEVEAEPLACRSHGLDHDRAPDEEASVGEQLGWDLDAGRDPRTHRPARNTSVLREVRVIVGIAGHARVARS